MLILSSYWEWYKSHITNTFGFYSSLDPTKRQRIHLIEHRLWPFKLTSPVLESGLISWQPQLGAQQIDCREKMIQEPCGVEPSQWLFAAACFLSEATDTDLFNQLPQQGWFGQAFVFRKETSALRPWHGSKQCVNYMNSKAKNASLVMSFLKFCPITIVQQNLSENLQQN